VPAAEPPLSGQPAARYRQTRSLLWIGFGGLLLLMCALSASSISFLYEIEIRHETIRQDYVRRDRMREKLRSAIYVSGTYFRDFMLDEDAARAVRDRAQFLAAEEEIRQRTAEYSRVLSPVERAPFGDLRDSLTAYFAALTPALAWDPEQVRKNGSRLIAEQLLPRRMTAIALSDRLQQYSERQLEADGQAVSDMFASFRTRLLLLLLLTVAIGAVLAAVIIWRLLNLERISSASYREAVAAREESKQLSAELVAVQENERRRISRELHDEVGQVLSALMLGIGNIRSLLKREGNGEPVVRQLQLIEDMTERSARAVRNLSLVLRPTMLDDLGLIAALRWLAREISRNSPLQVEVIAEDAPDELPEEHRTCVYRVVQEAIRNASRHSGARHARITVDAAARWLRVAVQDEGKGFNAKLEKGMGILGMEERVERLGGRFHVDSEAGRGARITFELPLPEALVHAPEPVQETSPFRTA
jgi:signal transduction histidine kinase